jgi:cytochrome c oxidase accessory protein FixG
VTDSHTKSKRIIPITAEDSQEQMVFLYEKQKKIYPRMTQGVFTNIRWLMVWITQIVFYGVPWLMWGDRQAFLLDISTHRFYIFGLVLYPQDLIYLAVILIISALALFLFTAVAGRLWCGFTCPQSVYTKIFLWIENKVEGDRAARIKLDSSPYNFHKLSKKSLKHALWILFSMWTGFTFLGYFTPIRGLFENIALFNLSPWETFWITFYGFATYGNAGFLREQVCKYMCPYARFQSAMFDKDTLIVSYDAERGEPRGSRSRNVESKEKGLGDCIDCSFCVQVCPTGIDIRDGLQYECISCGLCVDACNGVMDKMGYARGLIKFSTQNGVSNHWNTKRLLQQVMRPRVLMYSAVLLSICIAFVVSLVMRSSFNVDVIRDRGVMSRMAPGGFIENVYRLQITNATEQAQTYRISVHGLDGLKIASNNAVIVAPASTRMLPVSLQILDGKATQGTHKIMFDIEAIEMQENVSEKSIFFIGN